MPPDKNVSALVNHIQSLPDFELVRWEREGSSVYQHMGATITDGVLQAGINYKNVVEPRVQRLLKEYPQAQTSSAFLALQEQIGVERLLTFSGSKPVTVLEVTKLFVTQNVQTEFDLYHWLQIEDNFSTFRRIKGIGPKTVDYFKRLAGLQTAAPDRHLSRFLEDAGIEEQVYETKKSIISQAADQLDIPRGVLDHSIWKYMSERLDS